MKVSELSLPQLNAWVARAEETPFVMRNGFPCREEEFDPEIHCHESSLKEWKCWTRLNYSSEWDFGGPIIEREGFGICKFYEPTDGPIPEGHEWCALWRDDSMRADGPTPLIAGMRLYVMSKFGEEVSE